MCIFLPPNFQGKVHKSHVDELLQCCRLSPTLCHLNFLLGNSKIVNIILHPLNQSCELSQTKTDQSELIASPISLSAISCLVPLHRTGVLQTA